jgi:hypothetical protein
VVGCSSLLGTSVAETWLMSREKRGRLRMGSTKRRVTVRRTRPGLPDRRPGAQEVIARAHRLARILKLLRTELREVTPSQSKPRGLPAIATGSPRSAVVRRSSPQAGIEPRDPSGDTALLAQRSAEVGTSFSSTPNPF